jgi:predicted phage terminase large subunit-like protein
MSVNEAIKGVFLEAARKEAARRFLLQFTQHTYPDYRANWHHKLIASTLDRFTRGEIKRLMIFAPPQHGKTELATRRLASFMLGRDPSKRMAVCAYSATLASKFNREIQRIIDTPEYKELFPGTELNGKNVVAARDQSLLRNSFEFETSAGGYVVTPGICGALTSYTVDTAIIDDPYSGPIQAYSTAYRSRVSEWFEDVIEARLHNESQVVLTLTRWHHLDIAGEKLRAEGDRWHVLNLRALKEGPDLDPDGNEIEEREEGAPLWPERHSLEKLLARKKAAPSKFQSLYQGNPTAKGGGMIKTKWFGRFLLRDLPENYRVKYAIDSAYTENQENDPTAVIIYTFYLGSWYILEIARFWKGWNEAVKLIPDLLRRWDPSMKGLGIIEPKATGKSLVQALNRASMEGGKVVRPALNVKEAPPPRVDKVGRLNTQIEFWETGKIKLLEGSAWIPDFEEEAEQFPKGAHDDQIDALMIAVNEETGGEIWQIGKR